MNVIKYLLDENVDPLYRTELLKREPEMVVWRVGMPGTPPSQTLDPDILRWCEQHGFVLVTNNRKSMPMHLRAQSRPRAPGRCGGRPPPRRARAGAAWPLSLARPGDANRDR